MAPVSISNPEYSMEDGWHVASATISMNDKAYQLKFRVSEGPIARNSDPFLAAALFPAMRIGQPLQIPGTVSPRLLGRLKPCRKRIISGFRSSRQFRSMQSLICRIKRAGIERLELFSAGEWIPFLQS